MDWICILKGKLASLDNKLDLKQECKNKIYPRLGIEENWLLFMLLNNRMKSLGRIGGEFDKEL